MDEPTAECVHQVHLEAGRGKPEPTLLCSCPAGLECIMVPMFGSRCVNPDNIPGGM